MKQGIQKNKGKLPVALKVLIFTLITIVAWITFEVYRSFSVKPQTQVPNEILTPIDPNLDTNTLDGIRNRLYINENN